MGFGRGSLCRKLGRHPMNTAEIATLEDAGRASVAHESQVYEGRASFGFILGAVAPMLGILVIAAAVLFAFW
jgi:hypothetical protein